MNIIKTRDNATLTFELEGRLDTVTAPDLEKASLTDLDGVSELILDCAKLVYVSSAGLRVLLSLHKIMQKQGRMVLRHVSSDVMDVFDITGFVHIMTFE